MIKHVEGMSWHIVTEDEIDEICEFIIARLGVGKAKRKKKRWYNETENRIGRRQG